MVLAVLSWIMPFDSGLLDFSDAEVQFLFPAPVPRRQLLLHRLLRSQIGMLFGAAVIGFGAGFTLSGFTRLRVAVAAWLMSLALKLYFTGVTLARTRLRAGDSRSRRVAWIPIAILTAALAVVGAALGREYQAAPHLRGLDAMILAGRASMSGLAGIVLWPFAALTAPMFAPWPLPYLASLGGAALVTAALGAWVIASDGVFQEATAEVAARRGQQSATAGTARYKVRSTGWALASVGRPELAFAWKGCHADDPDGRQTQHFPGGGVVLLDRGGVGVARPIGCAGRHPRRVLADGDGLHDRARTASAAQRHAGGSGAPFSAPYLADQSVSGRSWRADLARDADHTQRVDDAGRGGVPVRHHPRRRQPPPAHQRRCRHCVRRAVAGVRAVDDPQRDRA